MAFDSVMGMCAGVATVTICIGMFIGDVVRTRQCADEQVSENPAAWWQRELIHARARKEARSIKSGDDKQA